MMRTFLVPSFLVCLLAWVGCSTPTNLTPSTLVRTTAGEYLFEVDWTSSEANIRENTLNAFVLIGTSIYPMTPSDFVPDRFEASIPIDSSQNSVSYRFKFEYQLKGMPEDRPESRLSPPYILRMVEQESRPETVIPY